MKLKDLKAFLDTLSPKQLEQRFLYNSKNNFISGEVSSIEIAKENLYYDGDDDPSVLRTKKELKEDGFEKEDIDEMEIEIPKGAIYIDF